MRAGAPTGPFPPVVGWSPRSGRMSAELAAQGVDTWQILEGVFKSFFFVGAIGLISCYKGFTCGSGASGVGRACTESFVASFIAIIVENFFFARGS